MKATRFPGACGFAAMVVLVVCLASIACAGGAASDNNAESDEATSAAPAGATDEPTRAAPPPAGEVRRIHIESYKDVEELFEELNYTPAAWQAGIREVPRLYLTQVGKKWRSTYSKEVSVQTKKRLFFRAMAPLVLRSNELTLRDRGRATTLIDRVRAGATLVGEDRAWLGELLSRYKVADSAEADPASADLQELLKRVDIVPVSLALSQSAEESGWGTSRFAAEGNSLFGQWSWGKNAIKPDQQRAAKGNYGIAAFETPLQSVRAYALNLNTHNAYAELRTLRARMREQNARISGRELATTLTRYSERGPAYVDSLHAIMRVNHLDAADDAYLGDGPTIFLIPASAAEP